MISLFVDITLKNKQSKPCQSRNTNYVNNRLVL